MQRPNSSHGPGPGPGQSQGTGQVQAGSQADDMDDGKNKLKLACLLCRSKKARCSGTKPRCDQCSRLQLTCIWPDGRRRKRTKREMELDSETLSMRLGGGGMASGGTLPLPWAMNMGMPLSLEGMSIDASTESTLDTSMAMPQPGFIPPTPGTGATARPDLSNFEDRRSSLNSLSPTSVMSAPMDPNQPIFNPSLVFDPRPHSSGEGSVSMGPPQPPAVDWNSLLGPMPGPHCGGASGGTAPFLPPVGSTGNATATASGAVPITDADPLAGPLPWSHEEQVTFVAVPRKSSSSSTQSDASSSMVNLPSSSRASGSIREPKGSKNAIQPSASREDAAGGSESKRMNSALVKSLTNQIGYLEGDQDEPFLRVHYYRIAGSTSLAPGINRVSLKLRLKNVPGSGADASQGTVPASGILSTSDYPARSDASPQVSNIPNPVTFDPETNMPVPEVYLPLLKVFFEACAQHFPSIQPKRIYSRIEDGTMSAFLLCAMCAVAARFAPNAQGNVADAGNVFMDRCAELLVPLIRLPTTDGVTGLQLMAWCEFALNSESGFWLYAGLAFRMAEDMGFHKATEEIFEDSHHYIRNKLLFWSLFVTDRLLSFATGRTCAIREDTIELPLPTDQDMIPVPTPEGYDTTPKPSPFVALVKLMVICGRISDLLNGSRGAARTLAATPPRDMPQRLSVLQEGLIQFYNSLPPALSWSINTFKHFATQNQGGIFLTLHCVANSMLVLLHHPSLLTSPNGQDTPMSSTVNRSIELSLASSRMISECMVFADLASPISFLSSPQLTQSLYVAGLAFVHEIRTAGMPKLEPNRHGNRNTGAGEAFLHLIAQQNLDIIFRALKKLESHWAGAGVTLYVLKQRAEGLHRGGIDFEKSSDAIPTFVSVKDAGVLKRFAGNIEALAGLSPGAQLQAITAAASPASTQARTDGGDPKESFTLEQLLSRYAVDDLFVESTGGFNPETFDLHAFLNGS